MWHYFTSILHQQHIHMNLNEYDNVNTLSVFTHRCRITSLTAFSMSRACYCPSLLQCHIQLSTFTLSAEREKISESKKWRLVLCTAASLLCNCTISQYDLQKMSLGKLEFAVEMTTLVVCWLFESGQVYGKILLNIMLVCLF